MPTPVLSRIQQVAADVFEVALERMTPESSPDTIESWDSLHHLNLVLALEQEFAVEFTPEEIEQLLSIELIASLVTEKVEANRALAS